MVNPSVMQQLGKEHEREMLAARRVGGVSDAECPGVRERLGWSLIGLGVHLALDGRRPGQGPWHSERVGVGPSAWRSLVRP